MRRVEKIETAVEPRFQEHFVGAMGIPHTTDPYPRPGRSSYLPGPPHRGVIDRRAGASPARELDPRRGASRER